MNLPATARRSAFMAIFAVIGIVCVAYGATANPQDWAAITVGIVAFGAFAILLVAVLVVGETRVGLDKNADRLRKEADSIEASLRTHYRGRKASVVFDRYAYQEYEKDQEELALLERP